MNDDENKNKFYRTDGGKTKSNAIEIPSISLPKGGGAIKGIDEKFSVNAVNGTAGFSIPLPFSPARALTPSLALGYNSGSGNGVFGLGWSLNLGSIKIKTDKGLPTYNGDETDTYLFSEAEDLVPAFQKDTNGAFLKDTNNEYIIKKEDRPSDNAFVTYYLPRIEGLFARIEKWEDKDTRICRWKITTRDNTTTLFGWTENSRIADPADGSRIFEWLPEFIFDDKGNCSQYVYKKEDTAGFDPSLLHNKNRFKNGDITYTNTYLSKILYGNTTPYAGFNSPYPSEGDYVFSTVFDYGEYQSDAPFTLNHEWDFREDAFSDYRAGFEIRTTRLCKRVLLFHHFRGANEYDGLVRSLDLEYDTGAEEDFTFLKSVTTKGFIKDGAGYSMKAMPPMEFEYQAHDWNDEVKTVQPSELVHAPYGFDDQLYQFTDLFNEGLNGILTEQANGWYYKPNLGDGQFGNARLVSPKPSYVGLGSRLQLADLDADGGKQIVSMEQGQNGFFELTDEEEWQAFRAFHTVPNIDTRNANVRMLDLNGDGKTDLLLSEDNRLTCYQSNGRKGYDKVFYADKPFDEEAGPNIFFADSTQTIFLADMNGDGLTDIVRIKNCEVTYWPNLGYGRFGTRVSMDDAPYLDSPDQFNPSFIRIADIDGSGTPDIIYLGKNKFSCWKNLSGNCFSTIPFEIEAFPEIDNTAHITVTDLLGNGTSCIVWSSPLSGHKEAPLRYIDLTNSKKPHILIGYKNNFGKEVTLEYKASTKFYIEDKLAGRPWITKLHFPVHCISKTITEDKISGYRFESSYKYHHGYYDHAEREFRGFGMVEQKDAEFFEHWVKESATNITEKELHQEPVVSRSWFHTGAFMGKERILTQFKKEYWHAEMERRGHTVTNIEKELKDAKLIAAPGIDPAILQHLSADE